MDDQFDGTSDPEESPTHEILAGDRPADEPEDEAADTGAIGPFLPPSLNRPPSVPPSSPPPPPPPTAPPPAAASWSVPDEPGGGGVAGRRRYAPFIAVGLAAALLGGAAGGGIAAAIGSSGSSVAGPTLRFANNSSVVAKPQDVQGILSKVEPGVIDISVQGTSNRGPFSFNESGEGTGMVISSNGLAVTNAHVVSGANSVSVTFPGQSQTHTAHVVGADTNLDIALIQIDNASNLPTVQLGDSSNVQVGDSVIAVGNALGLSGSPTVTEGIVSALNRSLDTGNESLSGLIQTDAAINPGNSGGALVNASGQVIGMNTAVASGTSQEPAQGIGFAIPINEVKSAIPNLQHGGGTSGNGGSTPSGNTAFLGVRAETLTPDIASQINTSATSGAVVDSVQSGTPAETAGLRQGDVITGLGGQTITSVDDLTSAVHSHHPGDQVKITWISGNQTKQANVTLASAPGA